MEGGQLGNIRLRERRIDFIHRQLFVVLQKPSCKLYKYSGVDISVVAGSVMVKISQAQMLCNVVKSKLTQSGKHVSRHCNGIYISKIKIYAQSFYSRADKRCIKARIMSDKHRLIAAAEGNKLFDSFLLQAGSLNHSVGNAGKLYNPRRNRLFGVYEYIHLVNNI